MVGYAVPNTMMDLRILFLRISVLLSFVSASVVLLSEFAGSSSRSKDRFENGKHEWLIEAVPEQNSTEAILLCVVYERQAKD